MATNNEFKPEASQLGRQSWFWTGALLAVALSVAGCNRGGSSDQTDDGRGPTDKGANSTGPGVNGVTPKTDSKSDTSHGTGDEGDPAPTFVKTRIETIPWADTKSRKIVHTLKVFSDGTTILDGDYDQYYRAGQHEMHGQYVEGKKQGKWTIWHDNGELMKIETYLNGQLNGKITQYRDDKTLERETEYKGNKRDGVWNYYDDHGKTLLKKEVYADGKPTGTWIVNYPDGKPKSEISFLNGERNGAQTEYYDNGQKSSVQNFQNGVLHGKYFEWSRSGALLKETQFDHGVRVTGSSSEK